MITYRRGLVEERDGQVWIETVLYTLIGLALIGITLSFVMPKINASRDRAIIEQSMESLSLMQKKIDGLIEGGSGNVRKIDMLLKVGSLIVIPNEDKIIITLDEFGDPYTEPGSVVSVGRIDILTEKNQKKYKETISISYSGIADITYYDGINEKRFNPSVTPKVFVMKNLGTTSEGLIKIDIKEFV